MLITITKIHRSTTSKDGKPFLTKDGRPYERIAIQCTEYGSKWLSGFSNRSNAQWREKDKVEVEVEQKNEYLNFRNLSEFEKLSKLVAELQTRIARLEAKIK